MKTGSTKFFPQSLKKGLCFFIASLLITSHASAQLPTLEWVASMGGSSIDVVRAVDTDSQGNIYALGDFSDTVDFDPGLPTFNLTSNGSSDVFILKLDASGNFLWAKSIGGAFPDGGNSVTIDSNDDVYITGYFGATVDFDPGPGVMNITSNGGRDLFVQKFDASGNFLWVKTVGGTNTDVGQSIITDASGDVYISGGFSNVVDFDPGPGTMNSTSNSTGNFYDAFVLKLDSNGNFIWVKTFGGDLTDFGKSMTIDSSGIYVVGFFNQTVDFDPGTGTFNQTANGGEDMFIQKLNLNGDFSWVKVIGGSDNDRANSVSLDMNGNVYTTGSFRVSPDFDPGVGTTIMNSNGGDDIFIHKMDTSGNFIWANSIGSSGLDYGESITTDSDGNIYITGGFRETADFDSGSGTLNLTANGGSDIYVQKLDPNGNHLWTYNSGSPQNDLATCIVTDLIGNIFVGGLFQGTIDFDPGPGMMNATSNGISDGFLQKFASEVCQTTTSIDVQSACMSYTWIDGNTYTTSNNTATETLINAAGCDSIITLDLTINSVSNVGVTSNAATLTADLSPGIGITYNWLDCDNIFSPVGIVTQSFSPTSNGNYAVEVSENQCVDTSACLTIDNVSLDVNALDFVSIVPNPAQDFVKLAFRDSEMRLTILDVNGKIMDEFTVSHGNEVDIFHYDNGVYFFWLKSDEFEIVKRVLKY